MNGRREFAMVAIFIFSIFLFVSPNNVSADLITVDFDLDDGTIVSDQYAGLGVVFSGYDYEARDIVAGVFSPSGTITLNSYCNAAGYIQADFSIAVDYVSVDFTSFEGDALIGIHLYDSSDNLLSAVEMVGINLVTQVLEAQVATPNVAYARFFGVQNNVNSVYNDSFTFGTTPVPEPATIILLGTGLISLVGISRKKLKG